MARPTAAERRRDYLQVGAELVAEFDLANAKQVPLDALANVKVADVARRAGVTKGALYHIWESQEEYRRDLLRHLLEAEDEGGTSENLDLLRQVPADDDAEDALRRLSQMAFDRLKDDPKLLARFSFYNYADDPEVNELLRHGTTDLEPYFEGYLRFARRRVRPPFTLEQLAVSVSAYFFGTIIRYRTTPTTPDAVVRRDGADWSLYSFGLISLLEHFTEPDPDA